MIDRIARSGVRAVSVSLDGCRAQAHDGVRGIAGHFDKTITAIAQLAEAGVTVQVNTTVMDANVDDLPGIAALMTRVGAHIWEVFFLVQVGRGTATAPLPTAGMRTCATSCTTPRPTASSSGPASATTAAKQPSAQLDSYLKSLAKRAW